MLALVVPACGWLQEEAKAARKDLVDCTTTRARGFEQQFGPVVDQLLLNASGGDGKVNWDIVKSATKTFAAEAGGCVLAGAVLRALTPRDVDPNAPQSSPQIIDPITLRQGWESARADYGGQKFKLEAGTL
ncbi:MAG: hypothetical protein M3619_00545 [Myxococcota bacterium]|nr:hypothetical protein [Myxococcota bacterium]